jgi:hypothetical protein
MDFGLKRVFLVVFKGFRSKLVQNPVFGLFLIKKGGQKGPFLDHFWGVQKRPPKKGLFCGPIGILGVQKRVKKGGFSGL